MIGVEGVKLVDQRQKREDEITYLP
jgi:hypothetical protein